VRNPDSSPKRWFAAYAAWTALCVAAFVALGNAEDPSRPAGRISPYLAEIAALDHLETVDPKSYANYETVDSAIYRDRESGRRVWLVLCDDEQPTRLTRAVIVEVDAASGTVIRIRPPGGELGAGERAR